MEITEEMRSICRRISQIYKQHLQDNNAVATGTLVNALDKEPELEADDFVFSMFLVIPNYWKYAPENERNGNKRPPIKAIQDWIDAKNLDLNAFAVAENIAKYGWKDQPRKNLQETLDSQEIDFLLNELCDLIQNQMEDDVLDEL